MDGEGGRMDEEVKGGGRERGRGEGWVVFQ